MYKHKKTPPYYFGWLEIFERNSLIKLLTTIHNSLPMLYIEDVYLTGFMAQSAGIKQIGLNHDLAIARCGYKKVSNFANKAVIGDNCKPNDLHTIHTEKLKLNIHNQN